MNDLKQHVYACDCRVCKAVVCLIEEKGAVLQFSTSKGGRLCELAVVAASGDKGVSETDVVHQRRNYARHLGIELSGVTSNAGEPVHIRWALMNSNHNPNARNRINIGRAKASHESGRYFLR
jgi:hypothetical protein